MPAYLAPVVFVEEGAFRAKSIEGVSTTTTGFISPSRDGTPLAFGADAAPATAPGVACRGTRCSRRPARRTACSSASASPAAATPACPS